MSKCFVFMHNNENDLNGNIFFLVYKQSIRIKLVTINLSCYSLWICRIWHNWPNWGRKQQLYINTITLLWDNASYYQLTNVFKLQKWMSCLWQRPKMNNYDETSRGKQSVGRHDIPWSDPRPPSSPALPAARHNLHSGTDRLTNKVNKYFPPLLKANQILILEVWSAEKKKKTTTNNW